jgi:hypothetical protein
MLVEDALGARSVYYRGRLHSVDDAPAVEFWNGTRDWFAFGVRHRGNGLPARVHWDGSEEYWENGVRHRAGGLPAVVCRINDTVEYWVHGRKVPAPPPPRAAKVKARAAQPPSASPKSQL